MASNIHSIGTIARLIDMGVEPFLIVSTVKTIIAQRLIRKLIPNKEQYFLSSDEIKNLGRVVDLDRMLKLLSDEKLIKEGETWDKIPFYLFFNATCEGLQ